MRLTDGTEGLVGAALEDVHLDGEALDDYQAFWNRSAKVDAIHAIASETTVDEFDEAGAPDAAAILPLVGADDEVLEIGCGAGRILRHVAPHCRLAHGIDISDEMISLARDRLSDLDNVQLVVGNGYDLAPFGDESLDVVYSHFVLQHVPRTICFNYLTEAHRVLRPGGRIRLQVPNLLRDDHFLAFRHFTQPHFVTHPYPMYFFTPIEIVSLLCRTGFRVSSVRDYIEVEARKSTEPGIDAGARTALLEMNNSVDGPWPELRALELSQRAAAAVRSLRNTARRLRS